MYLCTIVVLEVLDRKRPDYPWAQLIGLTDPSVFDMEAAEKQIHVPQGARGYNRTKKQVSGWKMAELNGINLLLGHVNR